MGDETPQDPYAEHPGLTATEVIVDKMRDVATAAAARTGAKARAWVMGPWWLWLGVGMWLGFRSNRR